MDRISILRCKDVGMDEEGIKIIIQPGFNKKQEPMPIYEGIMTLEEFAKCITNLSFCEIKTLKIREIPIETQ